MERLAAAEQQLEITRNQGEANLQSELSSHAQELDGVRSDYSAQLAAAAGRISTQMREISELHTKVALSEAAVTKVKIDLERQADEAVAAAREAEKAKAEQTIADLRQRLQAFLSTRAEAETRCEDYLREIKTLQTEAAAQAADMNQHVTTVEAELQRMRAQNTTLKDSLSAVESQHKLASRELVEAKSSMREWEDKADGARREALEAVAEQHRLREKSASLEAQLAAATEARGAEFSALKVGAMRALESEFETMRLSLRIKVAAEQAPASGAPPATVGKPTGSKGSK